MKSLFVCFVLMIVGIVIVLFIGFYDYIGSEEIVYDDDQEGLQD